MVDTSQTKTRLDSIQNTISNINRIEELNNLLEKTVLQLDEVLDAPSKTLYVDNAIITKLTSIRDTLTPPLNLQGRLYNEFLEYQRRTTPPA